MAYDLKPISHSIFIFPIGRKSQGRMSHIYQYSYHIPRQWCVARCRLDIYNLGIPTRNWCCHQSYVEKNRLCFTKNFSDIDYFFFVNILWVLFRADNIEQAHMIIQSMFDNFDLTLSPKFRNRLWSIFPQRVNFALLIMAILLSFFGPTAYQYMTEKKYYIAKLIITIILFILCIFLLSRISTFLYFNF